MQRFLSDPSIIDFDNVAWFIIKLFGLLESKYCLIFDRTNWQWGKKDINILMLAVVYKGIAIPVYWILLNREGNSNTRERIALTKRFIAQFGKQQIIKVLADREFVGKKWFNWLKSENIDFAIRIKKNTLVTNSRGTLVHVQKLFWLLKPGESLVLPKARKIYDSDVSVYLSALRLEDGKLLIVATAQACADAIEIYAKRWQIETLFSCLKGRGFNFEDTHITDRRRIKRLLVVTAIAFCWAHRVGEWQHEIKPIKVKKHQRLAQSLFKQGFDAINEALFNFVYTFENTIKVLFCFLDFNHQLFRVG